MRINIRTSVLGLVGGAVLGAVLGTASAYAMGDASSFRHERNTGLTRIQATGAGKVTAAPSHQSARTSFSDTATSASFQTMGDRAGSDWYLPANHIGGR